MAAPKTTVPSNQKTKRTSGFFKGMIAELKKVHWPTKKEVAVYTGVVIVAVVITAIVLSLVDTGLSAIFTQVLG
jgi:preprotein translocase subunit SecE